MEKQRIDRFLSNQLNFTRSEVRTGIRRGFTAVNGQVIKDAAYLIDPGNDKIFYDGNIVLYKRYVYIMLNKPAGIISAARDKNKKTVLDLVPDNLSRKGLSVVGRLDKDTTGLIIITDDGDFAHKCISPKSKIEKSYIAELDGDINPDIIKMFANGITLADGYICKPASLEDLGGRRVRIIITEGKYHQIKRMFGVVGLGVNSLHRERIGGLWLPQDLGEGDCIEMSETAIKGII